MLEKSYHELHDGLGTVAIGLKLPKNRLDSLQKNADLQETSVDAIINDAINQYLVFSEMKARKRKRTSRKGDFMTDEEEIPIHPPVVVTTEIDTIVVPVREGGFQKRFTGDNCWYPIRISKKMIPKIKYIVAYQVAPVSAITYIAPVKSIKQWQDSNRYIVHFAEPAREIGPINLIPNSTVKAHKHHDIPQWKNCKMQRHLMKHFERPSRINYHKHY